MTRTSVSVTLPTLRATNVNVSTSPTRPTVVGLTVFTSEIAGAGTTGTLTPSDAVTVRPDGARPVAVAMFSIVPASTSAWVAA